MSAGLRSHVRFTQGQNCQNLARGVKPVIHPGTPADGGGGEGEGGENKFWSQIWGGSKPKKPDSPGCTFSIELRGVANLSQGGSTRPTSPSILTLAATCKPSALGRCDQNTLQFSSIRHCRLNVKHIAGYRLVEYQTSQPLRFKERPKAIFTFWRSFLQKYNYFKTLQWS